jgi:ubiquinone/menaquinone biosynthesis C-methylase UbiE
MRRLAALAGLAVLAVALWWRKNPSACPYGQRFWVEAPHPFITRENLRNALKPGTGERVLELGPGTGYYTLELASWLAPDGAVDIFDLQQEMLDHTMRRVAERGLANVIATQGDATNLPYEDSSFDAVILTAVLGEIPDQDAALREITRVLKPGGRLIVGELLGDPHYTSPGALRRRGEGAGMRFDERLGPPFGYFARLVKPV